MSDTPGNAPDGSPVSRDDGDVVEARDLGGGFQFRYGRGSDTVPPQQLPRGVRIFVDRIFDLDQLDELLISRQGSDDPVMAYLITGTAGVGKTSLALHWGHRVRDQFPDGQLYVNLRGYDPGQPVTADSALEAFLLALGVPAMAIPNDTDAKSSEYRSIVASKQMLIILDNAGNVSQVRPLLPGISRSLAIITSRSRLSGLIIRDGAKRATLNTLSEAESTQLLRSTTADYRAHDDEAEIAELARLCACLPLALRIAAERAASRPGMPLSQLIADLRDESALWEALSAGGDDEADAVRTVFAWSYRALPEKAARLFCQLGMHPGNEFSETAASALTDDLASVRSSLDVLVGACLLENKNPGRYEFHDLLRAYAIDQARFEISQEDQLTLVERICYWYLISAYSCALFVAHDLTLLAPPSSTRHDVRPASFVERSQAAQWYLQERSNLLGALRAAAGTHLLRITLELSTVLERIYASYNHFQDWQESSLAGLAAAQELGLRDSEAVMHESLGRLNRLTMRLAEAARNYQSALAIYEQAGDSLSIVKVSNGLAWVYLFGHRPEDARVQLDRAVLAVGRFDQPYWRATILYSLGYTYLQLRSLEEADSRLQESLRLFRVIADQLYESMVLTAISYLQRLRGDVQSALSTAQTAVAISQEMDSALWEATALLYLGRAQRAVGDAANALVSYQRSAVISRQEGDVSREVMAITGAGLAYADLERHADAIAFHRRAAQVNRVLDDRWKLGRGLSYMGDALAELGEAQEALQYRTEALALIADFHDPKAIDLRSQLRARMSSP